MGTISIPSAIPGTKISGKSSPSAHSDAERRRRRRAKISAQVYVKTVDTDPPFDEICMSVDVSRDGLLFTSDCANYRKGQRLEVTFPYSNMAGAINQGQVAEVVRIVQQAGGKYGIAVHFNAAQTARKGEQKAGTSATLSPSSARKDSQSIVLAIEPDARGADSMRNLLEPDGYTVVIVSTGHAALEVLRTSVPDALIAEVESEDMSGHDLCVIVKQNERLQKVPVILITRSAQPADYTTSHQLGAVVCMAKPFKPERLQHVVRLVAPPPALTGSSNSGAERIN